jgi:hypothetical protein
MRMTRWNREFAPSKKSWDFRDWGLVRSSCVLYFGMQESWDGKKGCKGDAFGGEGQASSSDAEGGTRTHNSRIQVGKVYNIFAGEVSEFRQLMV